jgi:hypothetical protein
MPKGPPGWQPDRIQVRLDGWVGNDPTRAPRSVAEAIARAMPQLGEGDTVADIKARMIARQLRHERSQRIHTCAR